MRDFNGIKVIAVDNGYGNVKTANTVTPTGLVTYDTEPIFSGSILEYDGKFYRVGEGHKTFVAGKATDDDNYILTLMAVAKEMNIAGIREANVHLAAGLPMTWIRRQREAFRAYLLRNERVSFRFNGKEYRVRFVGCSLFPQGYPAIVNRLIEDKVAREVHTSVQQHARHLRTLCPVFGVLEGASDHLIRRSTAEGEPLVDCV